MALTEPTAQPPNLAFPQGEIALTEPTAQSTWAYLKRNAEPTVRKWLQTPSTVILIRGNRRVGKSTTVSKVLEGLATPSIRIVVHESEAVNLQAIQERLALPNPIVVANAGLLLVEKIRQGVTIVLEEIQNCSTSFQIALQEGIDHMAQQSMFQAEQWSKAGALVLMGSLPGLVDIMVESRKNPLYQRITAKVSLQPFDTQEIAHLFRRHNLQDNPALLLTMRTVLGSMPFRYEQAFKWGLLKPTTDRSEVVKEFVASEFQQESSDAKAFYYKSFGPEVAEALKAVHTQKTKSLQLKAFQSRSPQAAFTFFFEDLYRRYGFVTPQFSLEKANDIARFAIVEPTLQLLHHLDEGISRPDLRRTIDDSDMEKVTQLEGLTFERWVREIVEDRYMLDPTLPLLPHQDFSFASRCRPIIETKLHWDAKDMELDFIASLPSRKLLLVGSCKRSVTQSNHKRLVECWNQLKASNIRGMLERLKVKEIEEWSVKFLHFAAVGTEEDFASARRSLPASAYLFSLCDLLFDFP